MTSTPPATYCRIHPGRETGLRCNRCDKYICASCAVRVPTGYRCKECIREQSRVYDSAQVQDYILAFVVASILSFIGSLIAQMIGFFILFIAPMAGMVISEAVRKVVNRRRSKTLFQVATIAVVLGGLPMILDELFLLLMGGGVGMLLGMLWPGIYIFLAASSTYVRLSGIQLRR
ncbi:MAG: hypothetical protein E3J88_02450 [Anaerolineales bacterium]|nr:MAG: hypothetical protein E3J88_02450 [Anaerolineales bacterium]